MARQQAAAPPPRHGYVTGASALCSAGGCQSRTLIAMTDKAMSQNAELLEQIGRQGRERQMTMTPQAGAQPCRALWCEEGGHSFSERDPGMKVVLIEGTDEAGAPVSESRTMCGGCAPRVSVRRTRPAAMPGQLPLPVPAPAPAPWPSGYEVPAPAAPATSAATTHEMPASWDPNGFGQPGWAPADTPGASGAPDGGKL